jgi:hypothetical protein
MMIHEVSSLQLNETKLVLVALLIMCNATACTEMPFSAESREIPLRD